LTSNIHKKVYKKKGVPGVGVRVIYARERENLTGTKYIITKTKKYAYTIPRVTTRNNRKENWIKLFPALCISEF